MKLGGDLAGMGGAKLSLHFPGCQRSGRGSAHRPPEPAVGAEMQPPESSPGSPVRLTSGQVGLETDVTDSGASG